MVSCGLWSWCPVLGSPCVVCSCSRVLVLPSVLVFVLLLLLWFGVFVVLAYVVFVGCCVVLFLGLLDVVCVVLQDPDPCCCGVFVFCKAVSTVK